MIHKGKAMAAALTIVLMSATGLFASGRWHAATTAGSVNEEKYSPRAVNPEEEGTDFTILNNAEAPDDDLVSQIRTATGGITIIGNVIYSDKPEGQTKAAHTGMVSFTTDGTITALNNKSLGGCYSAVELDGVYHNFYVFTSQISHKSTYYHKTYNTEDWKQIKSTTITNEQTPRALCTNGMDVYGCFVNDPDGDNPTIVFGKMDINDNTHTTIAQLPRLWNACAYGNDGFIYAVDMLGDLYKVTPASGAMTKVGATGVVPAYITGAAIDRASGRMFWTVTPADKSGNLYEVNTTTGAATKLCQFQYNDEIAGLYIPFTASGKAPASALNLKADFPKGALSGQLSFQCPDTTYDGTQATGALTYKVYIDGQEKASGTTAFGAAVSVPLSVPQAEKYEFSVILSNNEGESPKASLGPIFIGKDTPSAPESVTAVYADGKFTVSWPAVTTTVNGGYMDTTAVTYTITRMPGNVVVGSNVKTLSITDPVASPENLEVYSYTVTATCEGLTSEATTSNVVALGAIYPPYSNNFPDAASISGFTIIDGNNDGVRFFWGSGTLRISSTGSTPPMDDWIITPPVYLQSGKLYKFSVSAHNGSTATSMKEQLEVRMGNAPTAAAMNTLVIDTMLLEKKVVKTEEQMVSVPADGKYYFGVHGVSQKKGFFLYIDSIGISAPQAMSLPKPVENLKLTADMDCALKAVISGTAPSLDMEGSALRDFTGIRIERNGTFLTQLSDVQPGQSFSFTDTTMTAAGEYTYTLTATSTAGSSTSVSDKIFVGLNKPERVSNVKTVLKSDGSLDISWEAPVKDIDGKNIPAGSLTYYILDATNAQSSKVVVQNLTDTRYTYTVSGRQQFFVPGIFARDAAGNSVGVKGNVSAVGPAYTTPWKETFAGGKSSSIFATQALDGTSAATWTIMKDANSDVKSYDNDGGFLVCQTKTINQTSMMFTGRISLADVEDPEFKFYTYNLYTVANGTEHRDINELTVMVRELGDTAWITLRQGTVDQLCSGDTACWRPVTANLSRWKGKQVQMGIKVKCKYYINTLFDALSVDKHNSIGVVATDDGIRVAGGNGIITVDNAAEETVAVYDMNGRLICRVTGDAIILVSPGVYVATTPRQSFKLIVR